MSILRSGVAASAIALATLAAPAMAQPAAGTTNNMAEGEIVVTAQRRSERQVDVPISVATLSSEQLQTANVQQLADITKITPGVRFDFASGFFQPTIRGIGTAVTTSGGGGNVGIYIDGFYSPNPLAADFKLMNVQSIQVLKGPQGTLFGRNTTGGAILVQSAEPSTTPSAEFEASYGRFNELRTQGYATFGLTDKIAVDIEGMYTRGDGWLTDISNNRRVGDYKTWSVRTGLKVDLTDSLSVLLRYQHSYVNDPTSTLAASYNHPSFGSGAPTFAQPGQFTFNPNEIASGSIPEFFIAKSDVVQGTIKADLGFADLTSYTQYRKENVDSSISLDFSGANVFQLGLPNNNETWSQEFLMNSKPGGRLQWTAGLFYFSNKDIYTTFIDNAGSARGLNRIGGSGTTVKSYAGFLDATYEVMPNLFVTAGLRYAHDEVTDAYWNPRPDPTTIPPTVPTTKNFVPDISGSRVTPRFVVRYKPTDQSSIYASYTKGYKAAIIDVGGSCQNPPSFQCNEVKPETIDAYEVGFKYNESGLSFELSGYYYDYKNLQVSLFLAGRASIINAATSEIYGLDGQVRYDLTNNFQLNAGAAWTHARYKHFANAPIYTNCTTLPAAVQATCLTNGISFVVIPTTLNDVTMQRAPEFTGNVGARYTFDLSGGKVNLSGNLFYSSKLFFGPSGIQFPQKGYETLALRASWTDPTDRFTVAAWGDNVTNSRYRTQAQYNNFGIGANWSKPATYGIEVGAKF